MDVNTVSEKQYSVFIEQYKAGLGNKKEQNERVVPYERFL